MPTVLLIFKDPSAEEMIHESLGNVGYDVVVASNSEAAVRSIFSVKVDVVVVDVVLGDQMEWLRQRLRNSDGALPVVFLAPAAAQWLPAAVPERAGLDEVVIKPCSATDIRHAVERALAASHRARPSVVLGPVDLYRVPVDGVSSPAAGRDRIFRGATGEGLGVPSWDWLL